MSWEEFHEKNFMVGQLSGGCLSWGELFEANCPAGKSPEDNYPWRKFHGGNCLRGLCYRGNYSGVIVWRAKLLGVIVLGGVSLAVILCVREVLGLNFLG